MARIFRGRRPFAAKEKNYLQESALALGAGADQFRTLALADDGVNANSVSFPSRIKAIYLEFRVEQTAARSPRLSWCLYKSPANLLTAISAANIEAAAGNNQFVIRAGQMSVAVNGGYSFAGYIMIPKRHQVFNENDALILSVNDGVAGELCLIATYKWEH